MALAKACATCRLRALIRHQSLTRQGRQCISTTSFRQQQDAGYVDSLYEKFDRSLNQPRRHSRTRQDRRNNDVGEQYGGTAAANGRYSRRPMPRPAGSVAGEGSRPHNHNGHREAATRRSAASLDAQELLEELAGPQPRKPRGTDENAYQGTAVLLPSPEVERAESGAKPPERRYSVKRLSDNARRGLPNSTVQAAEQFMNAGDDNQFRWASLRDMVKLAHDQATLQQLFTEKHVARPLFYLTMNVTSAFVTSKTPSSSQTTLQHLPPPSVLLAIRTQMTQRSSTIWPSVLYKLAHHVATLRLEGDAESLAQSREIMDELMTVWSLCMMAELQRGGEPRPLHSTETLLDKPSIDFSFLPEANRFQQGLQERGTYYTLAEILDLLVPALSFGNAQADFDYPSAALVTLDLLRNSDEQVRENYERWIAVMEVVVRSVTAKKVPRALAKTVADSENDQKAYFAGVVERFELRRPTNRHVKEGEESTANTDPAKPRHPLLQMVKRPPALAESSNEFDRYVYDAMNNLGRALEQNKLVYAQRTWENVQQNAAKYQLIQLPLWVYEMLLVTFIGLRDQGKVFELWQGMVKDGHQPTVKTYSIVMQGCRYINNGPLLEGFWASMRKAGLQPDRHAWSTRVFSLLKSRQIDAGIRVLGEMSQEWIAAARQAHNRNTRADMNNNKKATEQVSPAELAQRYTDDIDGVPRPNIVVTNSAVSALAAVNDADIPKVLSWARSFGIEPDLTTYNALLNVAMRRGEPTEAFNILRRMDSKGVQADGTTWTVLLTALFEGGFLDDLSPSDQQDKIMTFLTSLETANAATIDMKGYALVIDRLLKHHSNVSAADAVLRHMTERKLEPTPHIYTILMTSHFANPAGPDFPAIEGLWNRMRTSNAGYGVKLDSQFYDRMVEGYATHHGAAGSTKTMQMFLQRMWNEGKKPSWKALTAALRAFAERGEWERAKGLVGRVRRDVEGSRAQGQRFGQREFWGEVVGMGLLGLEEVPRVDVGGEGVRRR